MWGCQKGGLNLTGGVSRIQSRCLSALHSLCLDTFGWKATQANSRLLFGVSRLQLLRVIGPTLNKVLLRYVPLSTYVLAEKGAGKDAIPALCDPKSSGNFY